MNTPMKFFPTLAFCALPLCAVAAPLAFEVASIKPAPPPSDPHRMSVRMSTDAGRLTYSNVSLADVIRAAYRLKENQLSGPAWINSERYEISAKFPEGATKEQVPEMLQLLLAERFKFTSHRETKVMPVYALVSAKGGSKLKDAVEGKGGLRIMSGPKGRQMSGNVELTQLADTLSRMMDRPVVDMTELKGAYAIDLEWTPDESEHGGTFGPPGGMRRQEGGEAKPLADTADAPTIFTALQDKLGLKLDARKLPVDLLVVDSAEKVATEN